MIILMKQETTAKRYNIDPQLIEVKGTVASTESPYKLNLFWITCSF